MNLLCTLNELCLNLLLIRTCGHVPAPSTNHPRGFLGILVPHSHRVHRHPASTSLPKKNRRHTAQQLQYSKQFNKNNVLQQPLVACTASMLPHKSVHDLEGELSTVLEHQARHILRTQKLKLATKSSLDAFSG